MGTVTALPRGRALTREDLERMPDDGHRYELIDGTLVVTPAPSTRRRCPEEAEAAHPRHRSMPGTTRRRKAHGR